MACGTCGCVPLDSRNHVLVTILLLHHPLTLTTPLSKDPHKRQASIIFLHILNRLKSQQCHFRCSTYSTVTGILWHLHGRTGLVTVAIRWPDLHYILSSAISKRHQSVTLCALGMSTKTCTAKLSYQL